MAGLEAEGKGRDRKIQGCVERTVLHPESLAKIKPLGVLDVLPFLSGWLGARGASPGQGQAAGSCREQGPCAFWTSPAWLLSVYTK